MADLPWYETNEIMSRAGFDRARSRNAQIWAAKFDPCPQCKAPPFVACRNLTGIRNGGWDFARENKYPHPKRIDFEKLKQQLKQMGYE